MKNRKLRSPLALLSAGALAFLFHNQAGLSQNLPAGTLSLRSNFKFSGTFAPMPIDSNKDGLFAELITEEVNGQLRGVGAGAIQEVKLTTHTSIVEYGLTNPQTDSCTSCFRVNERDFSVQENAYNGPIAHLVRPIRDPVVNPSATPYVAEEWTAFYRLETGELIHAQVTALQICVEKAQPPESLFPICHVRSTEKIVGGTGRFKHATGEVYFTAIAPTYTGDAPLIKPDGCIDLSKPPPTFSFGPIYGAGQMVVHVPATDVK